MLNLQILSIIRINSNKSLQIGEISQASIYLTSNFRKMSVHNLLKPPEHVRNMQILDKEKFKKQINVSFITTSSSNVSNILPTIKKYLLKMENFKPVVHENDNSKIFLNPYTVKIWEDIQETDRNILNSKQVDKNNFSNCVQDLSYENYSVEDILRSVLPKDKEGSASFTKVGHIVHINLREHLFPFKKLIGEVLLEKVHGCKTVVNKINIIDNTYRNFKMEILAGINDFKVQLKENKCRFEFDFSTVYWNSRLCTEHERIVNLIKQKDVLFDVFAGVGPFSIPSAKKGAIVYANDLNPESYKWLRHNLKLNKIGGNLETFNKDGKDFILNDFKLNLNKHLNKTDIHIVMNLPAMATEFLNAFHNLYHPNEIPNDFKPPLIYIYCFAKGEDYITIAKNLVINDMGFDISDKITDIFRVRTVSSMKEMMRVTLKLDRDILIGHKRSLISEETGNSKKCCHGEKQKQEEQCV